MRILLITPYFAPYNNPRALRWTQIVKEWEQQGMEVDVVTGKHPREVSTSKINRVQVFRPSYPSPAARRSASDKTSSPSLSLLRKVYRLLFKNWIWPDDSRSWQKPTIRKAFELLETNQYDALITVSLPFSAHLVGWKIHNRNPEIPWIVDIGDPFALQKQHSLNNTWLYQQKNRKAEQRILSQADKVVCTNLGCRDLYLREFSEIDPEKVVVIPPTSALSSAKKQLEQTKSVLRVGYFGRFSQGIREPASFLPLLNQLQGISPFEWHFYGDTTGLLSAALRQQPAMDKVFQHPLLQPSKFATAIQEVDILLSLGNNTDFQIPSKIADYIRSGHPILHLSTRPESDPTWEMLKGHPLAYSLDVNADMEAIQKAVNQLEEWQGQLASGKAWKLLAEQVSVPVVAEAYLSAINGPSGTPSKNPN